MTNCCAGDIPCSFPPTHWFEWVHGHRMPGGAAVRPRLRGHRDHGRVWDGTVSRSTALPGFGASPVPSIKQAGCEGPQAQPRSVGTSDAPPPPARLAPGATSGLGCRQSPGHPAAHTPAVPRRGMGINRKPSAPAVPRDRPGMRRWPPDCLFGVKAAGSCREEPGSTRPGIARELMATSRKEPQHLWVCRDAQLWVPLAGHSHPSPLPRPGSGQCPEAAM